MNAGSTSRAVLVGGLAALAGAALAVSVAAHTSHSASSLTINGFTSGVDDNYVYGAVSSPNPDCAPGRKVRVFRKKPGSDHLLGADVSAR